MRDVCLIFVDEDGARAEHLASVLEAAGWTVTSQFWMTLKQTLREACEENLRDASCVVVLWSSHSVRSEYVNTAAEVARRKLIPVLIDAVEVPGEFGALVSWN